MVTKNSIEPEMSRRQLLGWLAVGASGLLVPAIVKPKPKVFDMGRCASGSFYEFIHPSGCRCLACSYYKSNYPVLYNYESVNPFRQVGWNKLP